MEPVDWDWVAERAKEVYATIKEEMERQHWGKALAIEAKSGDYFLGDRGLEAVKEGRKKHPDGLFFIYRIGHKAYVSYRGRTGRTT
jgi:hypothetical protein